MSETRGNEAAISNKSSDETNTSLEKIRAELFEPARGRSSDGSDAGGDLCITLMVRSRASDAILNKTLEEVLTGKRKPLTDREFATEFSADPQSIARVEKFARLNGLSVEKVNEESGQVFLRGSQEQIDKAFTQDFGAAPGAAGSRDAARADSTAAGRTATVPPELAQDVEAVIGLEKSGARAHSNVILKNPGIEPRSADDSGYMPAALAGVYKFPTDSMGAGQSVGIVELGGGLDLKDNAEYYAEHGLKLPQIQIVGVDGAGNQFGSPNDAEVALDSQVIGSVAPDARQQIIFAPNSAQGFVDAIARAVFPEKGEKSNSVISISWDAPELSPFWTESSLKGMDDILKKAALKGITVFAASGDLGASGGAPAGQEQPDFPSSHPLVTSCGGTELFTNPRKEVAWNDGGALFGATGGGISDLFDRPAFQDGLKLPANLNKHGKLDGRGTPDIAGDAAPSTGYSIRLDGTDTSAGGTSAVAPLYSALVLRVNSALGHSAGDLNPFLYENAGKGLFNDIVLGDNSGYRAGPGWDATTGWGSLRGDVFYDLLRRSSTVSP